MSHEWFFWLFLFPLSGAPVLLILSAWRIAVFVAERRDARMVASYRAFVMVEEAKRFAARRAASEAAL